MKTWQKLFLVLMVFANLLLLGFAFVMLNKNLSEAFILPTLIIMATHAPDNSTSDSTSIEAVDDPSKIILTIVNETGSGICDIYFDLPRTFTPAASEMPGNPLYEVLETGQSFEMQIAEPGDFTIQFYD